MNWRRRMGVEPTRERWRPQQDLKSCHITGYDTPPKKWRYCTEFIRIVQNISMDFLYAEFISRYSFNRQITSNAPR